MGPESTFIFNSEASSSPIRRTRSLMQGGAADPAIFNCALDLPASKFQRLCQRKGWGYQLEGIQLDIILYADNFWIFAKNAQEAGVMTRAWLGILGQYGFEVPTSELTLCATVGGNDSFEVEGTPVKRTPPEVGFKALGTTVTFNNGASVETQNLISRIWAGFFKNRALLVCKHISPDCISYSRLFNTPYGAQGPLT